MDSMGNLDSMLEDEDDDDLEVLSVVCSRVQPKPVEQAPRLRSRNNIFGYFIYLKKCSAPFMFYFCHLLELVF